MHRKKTLSIEVVVEHDSHYESGCLYWETNFGLSVSNTVRLLFFNQGNAKTDLFLSNWICVCFYVQERILKFLNYENRFFNCNKIICEKSSFKSNHRFKADCVHFRIISMVANIVQIQNTNKHDNYVGWLCLTSH